MEQECRGCVKYTGGRATGYKPPRARFPTDICDNPTQFRARDKPEGFVNITIPAMPPCVQRRLD